MKKLICILALSAFLTSCQDSLEEKAAKEARTYTEKNCPARIGENLIIDSLTYEATTRTLHYYYTLTGAIDNEEALKNADLHQVLLDELKNSTSMKPYKEAEFNFTYTYRSQKDPLKILLESNYTPKDYNKK